MFGVGMNRSATRLPISVGAVPAGQSAKCLFCANAADAQVQTASACEECQDTRLHGFALTSICSGCCTRAAYSRT